MKTDSYSSAGVKNAQPVTLNSALFEAPFKPELIKSAYVAYLANSRVNLAKTKTRGLVSGGGKKPWSQKGTGRARFGSSRNPIWRSGGIAFGPTGNENYSHSMPSEQKRRALVSALSLAAADKKIKVIKDFEIKDGKVSSAVKLLDKLSAKGRVLILVPRKDDLSERATANLSNVKVTRADYLTVFDVMNADTLVISEKSLDILSSWLDKSSVSAKTEAKK